MTRTKNRLKDAYWEHKGDAKKRGIEFLLTFDEWLKIWVDSGHLEQRGRKKDQYVMARFGDQGPYGIDNVKIVTCSENHATKIFTPEYRAKLRNANLGKTHSDATRKKLSMIRRRQRPTFLGKRHSEQTKKKISETKKRQFLALQETT